MFDETLTAEEQIARLAALNESKRDAARNSLGRSWLMHPDYEPKQRHSLRGWQAHSILAGVSTEARVGGRI